MKKLLITLCFGSLLLSGAEFKLWERFVPGETPVKWNKYKEIIFLPPTADNPKAKSIFALRSYVRGEKARLRQLGTATPGFGGQPYALAVKNMISQTLIFLGDAVGEMKSAPDLYLAFTIKAPENDTHSYYTGGWNYTQKKSFKSAFRPKPGWNFFLRKLHGGQLLKEGDLIRGYTIGSVGGSIHKWQIGSVAVWQGKDTVLPEQVKGLAVKADKDNNILSWQIAKDNLFVVRYHVYRGSVKNFKPEISNRIAVTYDLSYVDVSPMREDSWYKVIAEDAAGLMGPASAPARRP